MTGEKRQALFGGSFDPIHNGHLLVAELLLQLETLQEIVFVPAAQSPHKGQSAAPAEARVRMIQAALQDKPHFRCSTAEVDRPAPSWTIDTIRHYAQRWQAKPVLIVGGDSLLDLDSWRQSADILRESQVVVYARPGAEQAADAATRMRVPYHAEVLSNISSSELRARVRRGESLQGLVPTSVAQIIESGQLYRSDSQDNPPQRHRHS